MPSDNTQKPISNNQNPQTVTPVEPVVNDLPITNDLSPNTSSGSAAPSEDIVMPPIITTSLPKKKFAGGKIIATILGLFLLVGGVGAGIVLVKQNQNPQEKAGTCNPQVVVDGNVNGSTQMSGGGNVSGIFHCTGDPDNYVETGCQDEELSLDSNVDESCFCGTVQVDYDNGDFETYQGDDCGGSGGAGGCWEGKVDCPPGTVINPGQPINVFCSRNEASAAKPICSTGTAQRQTDTCCGGEDFDGEGTCGNPQFITYNCCPVDSPPVCTDTTSTYTKTVLHPTNPTGACWEFDQFGQFRRDTYKSHVDTNCGRRPGRDEETGEPNYACDYIVTCERKVTTCVCGTNTPPPTPAPTAQCQNVKAYSSTWALLTNAQLATLAPNESVNFCVTGSATGGSFDKAKFTINNEVQAETSTVRPSSTDFCQSFVIKNGINTYNVTAQIHHVTLGWK